MKKYLFLLLLAVVSTLSQAQTQQGIVKTRGRMVNGQVVAGQRLTGATITLNIGNPLVSGQNGAFSFNVPSGKNYSLVTAVKQGYTLADPDYTRSSFAYSPKNPFYVVLEDEAQRQADINAATRKVRRTLTAQLQAREDEIEELKEQNKLTEAEYQQRLQQLYDNQSKSEQLVKEMAERYASTDYDQLDEFNQQVQMLIEEGELQKADSMIRSKGDMAQRVADYHNVVAANQKARKELERSEAGAAKTYADLSQDLLRRSEIFLQAYQQDSALSCLKMRADLDTTNVEAVRQYAKLCLTQKKFEEGERYWLMCLHICMKENNQGNIAAVQSQLGALYTDMHRHEKAENMLTQSLGTLQTLFTQQPDAFRHELSLTLNNIGKLCFEMKNFEKAEEYYKQSILLKEELARTNDAASRADLALTQNNLGALYHTMNNFDEAEKYYKLALQNLETLFAEDPDAYRSDLSNVLNDLGALCEKKNDFSNNEQYLKMCLEHRQILFQQNPDAYREDLAMVMSNLGNAYIHLGDFAQSEKIYEQALELYNVLYQQNPSVYEANRLNLLNNLGTLYSNTGDFENSEKYYMMAMDGLEKLFDASPDVYRPQMAMAQLNLGLLYRSHKDLVKCEKFYTAAIQNYEMLFAQSPEAYFIYMAIAQNSIAFLYADKGDFDKAIEMADKAIAMIPVEANFYDSKGEILLMQGKNEEALAMWKKALEVNPDFPKSYPQGTNLYNGLKKLGLVN